MKFSWSINAKNLSSSQKDIINSFITKSWSLISGPLTLLFIPLYLSVEDQGLWFTFISLSALSVLADLGFSAIVLQFTAHEFAHLKFKEGYLIGDNFNLDRIASLFKFIFRWAMCMILIIFPVIALIGVIIFKEKVESINWILPWFIYLFASALNFLLQLLSSFIQGCNQVAKIQKLMLYFAITTTITVLLLLYLNFALYALAFSLLASVFVFGFLIYYNYKKLIYQLIEHKNVNHNWGADLLPLLRKYAISFISGYLGSQIYTPLVFHFKGAVEAGKVGLTISLITAIYSISYVWFAAMVPQINFLVAKKRWFKLDKLFHKLLISSFLTYIFGCLIIFGAIGVFSGEWLFFDKVRLRMLGLLPMFMLSMGFFFQLFISGSAMYLRAHKEEVYVYISLFMSLYISIITFFITSHLPISYLFSGYLSSYILFGYFILKIFKKYQLKWHN